MDLFAIVDPEQQQKAPEELSEFPLSS